MVMYHRSGPDLLDGGEPVSPVRLGQPLDGRPLVDQGEVELGRVPAADAVVRTEITLALERKSLGAVPLEGRK